jgi:hypothetical protein
MILRYSYRRRYVLNLEFFVSKIPKIEGNIFLLDLVDGLKENKQTVVNIAVGRVP